MKQLSATASSQKVRDDKTELSESALRSKRNLPEMLVKSGFFLSSKNSTSENVLSKELPAARLTVYT